MGHALTRPDGEMVHKIINEYVKCLVYRTGRSQNRQTLSLRELLSFSQLDLVRFDLSHLPLLYLLDGDKDGLFSIHDLLNLGYYYGNINHMTNYKAHECASIIQAYATGMLALYGDATSFIRWFVKLLEVIEPTVTIDSVKCVSASVIRVMHTVLKVELITRESSEKLLDTMQRAAVQMGLIDQQQIKAFNGLAPLVIVQAFGDEMFKAFKTTYNDLGLESIEIPKYYRPFDETSFPKINALFKNKLTEALNAISIHSEDSSDD